jgi:hypothetical protein
MIRRIALRWVLVPAIPVIAVFLIALVAASSGPASAQCLPSSPW